jgi:FkbM family methyltransferase
MTKYYSQIAQDRILNEELFQQARNGVFCDVGAHDGESGSNTLFFEKELGWTGICVEAEPSNFDKLKTRRKCVNVFGAAYNRTGTISFTANNGYTNMLSGVTANYNQAHRARIQRELNEHGGESKEITVPCYTLSSVFETHGVKTVDYLSIDTEGSELQVLEGIDFDKVHVNAIDYEVNYQGTPEHNAIRQFLTLRGFKYLRNIEWDEVWVNNDIKWSWA